MQRIETIYLKALVPDSSLSSNATRIHPAQSHSVIIFADWHEKRNVTPIYLRVWISLLPRISASSLSWRNGVARARRRIPPSPIHSCIPRRNNRTGKIPCPPFKETEWRSRCCYSVHINSSFWQKRIQRQFCSRLNQGPPSFFLEGRISYNTTVGGRVVHLT